MYKIVFLSVLLLMSYSSKLIAAPLKLPSRAQIIKMIKENPKANLDVVGLSINKDCKRLSIRNLKILKVGRASKNYYQQSGNYIDSSFKVKIRIKGSCELEKPVRISSVYGQEKRSKSNYYYRELKGVLPIRPIPLEVSIFTDDYGDWTSSEIRLFDYDHDGSYTEKTEAYIRDLYYQRNKAKVDKQRQRKIADKQYQENWKISQRNREIRAREEATKKQKNIAILRSRLAELRSLISKQEDITALRKVENKCIKSDWWCAGDISNFKHFYIPLVRAQEKYNGRIVKRIKNEAISPVENARLMKTLNGFFRKRPDIKKKFYSNSLRGSYKGFFSSLIRHQTTTQAKYLVFLELGKDLLGIQLSPSKRVTKHASKKQSKKGGATRHSHAGRYHSHKLPRQGKAHRHGNGAVGR